MTHTPIPMAPGYFASEDGRIFSASGWRGQPYRQMCFIANRDNYPSVRIKIGGKRKNMTVHRLIASAFLPPRPSLAYEVRHIDGDKFNCCAQNLAWGTRADNAADRERHGRTSRGQKHSEAIKRGNWRAA